MKVALTEAMLPSVYGLADEDHQGESEGFCL